ncbi:MAG TPA: hypothetical protein VGJ81_14440 [Thermoanaerobaculia bacterium]|jgi:death-on-curing protein
MAAAYLYGICRNQPFVDGQQTDCDCFALVFLELNGVSIEADEDEFYELVIGVAEGAVDKAALASFFGGHAARLP